MDHKSYATEGRFLYSCEVIRKQVQWKWGTANIIVLLCKPVVQPHLDYCVQFRPPQLQRVVQSWRSCRKEQPRWSGVSATAVWGKVSWRAVGFPPPRIINVSTYFYVHMQLVDKRFRVRTFLLRVTTPISETIPGCQTQTGYMRSFIYFKTGARFLRGPSAYSAGLCPKILPQNTSVLLLESSCFTLLSQTC